MPVVPLSLCRLLRSQACSQTLQNLAQVEKCRTPVLRKMQLDNCTTALCRCLKPAAAQAVSETVKDWWCNCCYNTCSHTHVLKFLGLRLSGFRGPDRRTFSSFFTSRDVQDLHVSILSCTCCFQGACSLFWSEKKGWFGGLRGLSADYLASLKEI